MTNSPSGNKNNARGLYIHVPFCAHKCLFCSFVVTIGQQHRADEYVQTLMKEAQTHKGAVINTVYLGGGTPSLLSCEQLNVLMGFLKTNFKIQPDAEITIEANPETIDKTKAKCLKDLQFTRVSLGAQSFNGRYLKFLGRGHDGNKARDAYGLLRKEGFVNINLDLMYAFPSQTKEEIEEDVRAVAGFGSEHVSLYTLTVEPNSRFYAKQMKLDDEDKIAGEYVLVTQILSEYGFEQYEVSNFAKPGFASQHNINYWQGGSYIGLGVGAHGYLNGQRYWNTGKLQDYFERIAQEGKAVQGHEDLSEETKVMEKVLFGLRMNQGVAWDLLPPAKRNDVEKFIQDGFFICDNGVLKATQAGRLVLDAISSRLI